MANKRDTAMIEDKDRDSVSLEKEAQTKMHQVKPGLTAEDVEWLNSIPEREQARIYHKVDRRLVPMLALLYLIGEVGSLLDYIPTTDSVLCDQKHISTERISAMRRSRASKPVLEWLVQIIISWLEGQSWHVHLKLDAVLTGPQ